MLYRKKSNVVTYLFSDYFTPVNVGSIIVKNCGFGMGFVILENIFDYKAVFCYCFNVKT